MTHSGFQARFIVGISMQIHMETANDYRSRAVTRTVEYSWLRGCEAARLNHYKLSKNSPATATQ